MVGRPALRYGTLWYSSIRKVVAAYTIGPRVHYTILVRTRRALQASPGALAAGRGRTSFSHPGPYNTISYCTIPQYGDNMTLWCQHGTLQVLSEWYI